METRTAAARELLYKACAMADQSHPQRAKYSSMAKVFCSDTAMAVTVDAVQVLGGYGYVKEYPVERMMRDAKITRSMRARTRSAARDRADAEIRPCERRGRQPKPRADACGASASPR